MTSDKRLTKMEWLLDVIYAIRRIGEEATLPEIYKQVAATREKLPMEWQAAIRATINRHSSTSSCYVPGSPDVFKSVCRGTWRLRLPTLWHRG